MYGNIGNACESQGDFSKAIEYHTLDLAIAKEVGDRAKEGGAYGNLGNPYPSLQDFRIVALTDKRSERKRERESERDRGDKDSLLGTLARGSPLAGPVLDLVLQDRHWIRYWIRPAADAMPARRCSEY